MAIERLLKNISLFVDGRGYAGKVDKFTPPKLTLKTEEFRAGGMDAPVEVDMGMEKMEATLALSGIDREALKLFGLAKGAMTPITLRGASQGEDGSVEAAVITMRGRIKDVDWGEWEPGAKAPCTLMAALRYYKLEVGAETIHEIDVENMIRIIDGTDQLAELRSALAL